MTVVPSPPGGAARAWTKPGSKSKAPKLKAPPSVLMTMFTFVVVVAWFFSLLYALTRASAEVWGALLLIPVLIGITIPLIQGAARRQHDPRLERLLMVALILKLVGAIVRYAVAFNVYGGVADAKSYDTAGRVLAAGFRAGHLTFGHGKISDTHFIEVVTGVVYTIIGPTQLGGFFVFSWLGFLGLFMFYRAFVLAVPHGEHRRYALMLFFVPSLLFWSSSIGKEAWMTFTLGAVAYGAARVFMRKPFGFVFLGLGLWGTEVVRPHMALLILGGLLPAYVLRRKPQFAHSRQSLKVLGVAALVVAIVITLGGVEQRFKVTDASATTAQDIFNNTADQTTQGGSSFTPTRVHNPIQLPAAFVTVMFRPFPNEAGTTQGVVSAFEGVFLMLLTLASLKRLRGLGKEMIKTPYVIFALIYALVFVYAFSTIGNFGILVRQRVQVYPLFFVLLALPKPVFERKKSRARGRGGRVKSAPKSRIPQPSLTR
jgi:hypothetical protein